MNTKTRNNPVFWGVLMLSLGLFILLGWIILRILLALVFVFLGYQLIKASISQSDSDKLFSNRRVKVLSVKSSYKSLFSKRTFTFSSILLEQHAHCRIQSLFSDCLLTIPAEMNFRAKSEALFSLIVMPNGKQILLFGSHQYRSAEFDLNRPYLTIKTMSLFSRIKVVVT